MQDDNNQSPRKKGETKLTYKMWKRMKNITESISSDQNQQTKYLQMLAFLDQLYSEAKTHANEPNCQQFTECTNKLRALVQDHQGEMNDILRELQKQLTSNQKMTSRLTQYQVANTELRMLLDKAESEKNKCSIAFQELNESLAKSNQNLGSQHREKQSLISEIKELKMLTTSGEEQNKNLQRLIKCMEKQMGQFREKLSRMYRSEKDLKQKYQNLKSTYDTVLAENGELLAQIECLNNENDQHKYQISKAFSVSHNDENGSVISGFKIAQKEGQSDDQIQGEQDHEIFKKIEGDFGLQHRTSIYDIQNFDKLTNREQEFDGQSTGRAHKRKQSDQYVEPNSDRLMVKAQTPRQSFNMATNIKARKTHTHLYYPPVTGIRSSFPVTPVQNRDTMYLKKVETKPKTEIGGLKQKKNVTIGSRAVENQTQKAFKKLKQEMSQKQKQTQLLKIQLKNVKKQVVDKCQFITKQEGEHEMAIDQLKQRLKYEKNIFKENSKKMLKLKSNIEFLKNLVISLVNKIYISEQFYKQVISKKCQDFLLAQSSFIEVRKSQIRNAISRLLKFYKDWIAPKDINASAHEPQHNRKRRVELQDIIEKLNGSDIQTIRKSRFKSSKSKHIKIQQQEENSEINSNASFYDNMVNQMHNAWDQKPKQKQLNNSNNENRYSLKKSNSLFQLGNEESLDFSIVKTKISKAGVKELAEIKNMINMNEEQDENKFQIMIEKLQNELEKEDMLLDPRAQFHENSRSIENEYSYDKSFSKNIRMELADIQCQTQHIIIIEDQQQYNDGIIKLQQTNKRDRLQLSLQIYSFALDQKTEKSDSGSQTTIQSAQLQIQTKWEQFPEESQTQFFKNCIQIQTDAKDAFDLQTQTEERESLQMQIQTEINTFKQKNCQTDQRQLISIGIQTQINNLQEKQTQTKQKQQIEAQVQSEVTKIDSDCQTLQQNKQIRCKQVQTLKKQNAAYCQTQYNEVLNGEMQTSDIDYIEYQTQTQGKKLLQFQLQTDLNFSDEKTQTMVSRKQQMSMQTQNAENIQSAMQSQAIKKQSIEMQTIFCVSSFQSQTQIKQFDFAYIQTELKNITQIYTQTEREIDVQSLQVQTARYLYQHQAQTQVKRQQQISMQTDLRVQQRDTQTTVKNNTEQELQTQAIQLEQYSMQTQMHMQTCGFQAYSYQFCLDKQSQFDYQPETSNFQIQTAKQTQENQSQTVIMTQSVDIQTKFQVFDYSNQTEVIEKQDGFIQTIISKDLDCQTQKFYVNQQQIQVVFQVIQQEIQTQALISIEIETQIQNKQKVQCSIQTEIIWQNIQIQTDQIVTTSIDFQTQQLETYQHSVQTIVNKFCQQMQTQKLDDIEIGVQSEKKLFSQLLMQTQFQIQDIEVQTSTFAVQSLSSQTQAQGQCQQMQTQKLDDIEIGVQSEKKLFSQLLMQTQFQIQDIEVQTSTFAVQSLSSQTQAQGQCQQMQTQKLDDIEIGVQSEKKLFSQLLMQTQFQIQDIEVQTSTFAVQSLSSQTQKIEKKDAHSSFEFQSTLVDKQNLKQIGNEIKTRQLQQFLCISTELQQQKQLEENVIKISKVSQLQSRKKTILQNYNKKLNQKSDKVNQFCTNNPKKQFVKFEAQFKQQQIGIQTVQVQKSKQSNKAALKLGNFDAQAEINQKKRQLTQLQNNHQSKLADEGQEIMNQKCKGSIIKLKNPKIFQQIQADITQQPFIYKQIPQEFSGIQTKIAKAIDRQTNVQQNKYNNRQSELFLKSDKKVGCSVQVHYQEKSSQAVDKSNVYIQTIDGLQIYSFGNVSSQTVYEPKIPYIFNKNLLQKDCVISQEFTRSVIMNKQVNRQRSQQKRQKETSSVTSSETLYNNEEKEVFQNYDTKGTPQITPSKTIKLEARYNYFVNLTPSTDDKNNHNPYLNVSKSPVQHQRQAIAKKNPSVGDLSVQNELTKQDLANLTPEKMFEKLLHKSQDSVFQSNRIIKVEKNFRWDSNKLYLLEVVDQNDKSLKIKKFLLWKKGIVSLENLNQLRVKPKGVRIQDMQMLVLGNSEVIARGNHIWVRRKNNRCSSVVGTLGDGNWKIVSLLVFASK